MILVLFLLLVLFFRLFYKQSRFYYEEPVLTVGALQFQKRTIVIESGQFYQLHLNWLNHRVSYQSENSLIATVNASGKVIALKPGKTVISANAKEKTAKSRVYVISFQNKISLKAGKTKKIQIKGKITGIQYRSENNQVAKVSRFGKITGVSKGKTVIWIEIYGFTFRVDVTVN